MTQPLRLGIAGLGTVGMGVVKIIQQKAEILAIRGGQEVVISAVSARSKDKEIGRSGAGRHTGRDSSWKRRYNSQ